MTGVVLYFQVHQPYRVRRYSVFDTDPHYFDERANGEICRRVAERCYRPALTILLERARALRGAFRFNLSLSGVVLEQFEAYCPDVIGLLIDLARSGCCEFLGETSHHSLAFVHSGAEFEAQVMLHSARIERLFGRAPRVFRNTELIYSNTLAAALSAMRDAGGQPRFIGCLAEGVDQLLDGRAPTRVFRAAPVHAPGNSGGPLLPHLGLPLLLRNYRLSDDIAFRFSNRSWGEWPLTAMKFAGWIDGLDRAPALDESPGARPGESHESLCTLFLDFETFGEHHRAETGVLRFLAELPEALLRAGHGNNRFLSASEACAAAAPDAPLYDAPAFTSWADTERDLSAWSGNAMQDAAQRALYQLEREIRARVHAAPAHDHDARRLLDDWRRLTTSDHFYYMCTKSFADGAVHSYFSPFDSPYDGYIYFMNVLDSLRTRLSPPGAGAARFAERATP